MAAVELTEFWRIQLHRAEQLFLYVAKLVNFDWFLVVIKIKLFFLTRTGLDHSAAPSSRRPGVAAQHGQTAKHENRYKNCLFHYWPLGLGQWVFCDFDRIDSDWQ